MLALGQAVRRHAARNSCACRSPVAAVAIASSSKVTSKIPPVSRAYSTEIPTSETRATENTERYPPPPPPLRSGRERPERTNKYGSTKDVDVQQQQTYSAALIPPAAQTAESASQWLNRHFPYLDLPDDVIFQTITHESFDFGMSGGHNRRLRFLGRRSIKFNINLFLLQQKDYTHLLNDDVIKRLVATGQLGDQVAVPLKLPQIMRWTPSGTLRNYTERKTAGLFKVAGVCLEALVGATFHQHGAQMAKAFFHAKILPRMKTFEPPDRASLETAIEEERVKAQEFLNSAAQARANADSSAAAIAISSAPQQIAYPFAMGPARAAKSVEEFQPKPIGHFNLLRKLAKQGEQKKQQPKPIVQKERSEPREPREQKQQPKAQRGSGRRSKFLIRPRINSEQNSDAADSQRTGQQQDEVIYRSDEDAQSNEASRQVDPDWRKALKDKS